MVDGHLRRFHFLAVGSKAGVEHSYTGLGVDVCCDFSYERNCRVTL